MGWRYAYFTLGALMIFFWYVKFSLRYSLHLVVILIVVILINVSARFIRIFIFPVYESPKFLASIGRDAEAVTVIHQIAKRNNKPCDLTVEDLHRAAAPYLTSDEVLNSTNPATTKFTTFQLIKASFSDVSFEHIKPLFSTPRLAYSTSLVIFCYASLGLAYPLYNGFLGTYLAQKNASLGNTSLNATYAGYTYQAACGIPGSLVAAVMVEWGRGGRKFAMAFFTIAAGVFLFGLTAARNGAQINALTCMASFFENAFCKSFKPLPMYVLMCYGVDGVLYGYAPEVFPTPSRGTGDALAAAASRITGIFAPVIAVYSKAALTPDGPVYASAGIFVA
jgi:hypothetical protein